MKLIEWQLQVRDGKLETDAIHMNTKIHCYIDGVALCNPAYWMAPGNFDTTEYGEKDIDTHPEYFCKRCMKKFETMKSKGEIA